MHTTCFPITGCMPGAARGLSLYACHLQACLSAWQLWGVGRCAAHAAAADSTSRQPRGYHGLRPCLSSLCACRWSGSARRQRWVHVYTREAAVELSGWPAVGRNTSLGHFSAKQLHGQVQPATPACAKWKRTQGTWRVCVLVNILFAVLWLKCIHPHMVCACMWVVHVC